MKLLQCQRNSKKSELHYSFTIEDKPLSLRTPPRFFVIKHRLAKKKFSGILGLNFVEVFMKTIIYTSIFSLLMAALLVFALGQTHTSGTEIKPTTSKTLACGKCNPVCGCLKSDQSSSIAL